MAAGALIKSGVIGGAEAMGISAAYDFAIAASGAALTNLAVTSIEFAVKGKLRSKEFRFSALSGMATSALTGGLLSYFSPNIGGFFSDIWRSDMMEEVKRAVGSFLSGTGSLVNTENVINETLGNQVNETLTLDNIVPADNTSDVGPSFSPSTETGSSQFDLSPREPDASTNSGTPDTSFPEDDWSQTPDEEMIDAQPDYDKLLDQQNGQLRDPETGRIYDKETLMEIDRGSGLLIDSETGQLFDPDTEKYYDRKTLMEIGQDTGLLIDPKTGDHFDPETGKIYDPETFKEIDPQTGELLEPSFDDPEPEQHLYDPETGEIKNGYQYNEDLTNQPFDENYNINENYDYWEDTRPHEQRDATDLKKVPPVADKPDIPAPADEKMPGAVIETSPAPAEVMPFSDWANLQSSGLHSAIEQFIPESPSPRLEMILERMQSDNANVRAQAVKDFAHGLYNGVYGLPKNVDAAYAINKIAIDINPENAQAVFNRAYSELHGIGVKADLESAEHGFRDAIRLGYKRAHKYLDYMARMGLLRNKSRGFIIPGHDF